MSKQPQEYSLADLLDDPLVVLMMKSDGVDRGSVERLFAEIDQSRFSAPENQGSR